MLSHRLSSVFVCSVGYTWNFCPFKLEQEFHSVKNNGRKTDMGANRQWIRPALLSAVWYRPREARRPVCKWFLLSLRLSVNTVHRVFVMLIALFCVSLMYFIWVLSLTTDYNIAVFLLKTDASCLTWEGEGFQGKNAIMTKLNVSWLILHNCHVQNCLKFNGMCVFAEPPLSDHSTQHHRSGPSSNTRQLRHEYGHGPAQSKILW